MTTLFVFVSSSAINRLRFESISSPYVRCPGSNVNKLCWNKVSGSGFFYFTYPISKI